MKLNVGCGRDAKEGWVNLDCVPGPGIDIVCDLEKLDGKEGRIPAPEGLVRQLRQNPPYEPMWFMNDTVDEFLLSHVLEHIRNHLGMMQELWRVAKPGARMKILCPHGASDDAWEDPTHVRPIFPGSLMVFQQPYYWRASYGYTADWRPVKITLVLSKRWYPRSITDTYEALYFINTQRNMVAEIQAELEAVKPAREPRKELQETLDLALIHQE